MKKRIGIKAYGTTRTFKTVNALKQYLLEWFLGTDGAEQERAVRALGNLMAGVTFTDTDAM